MGCALGIVEDLDIHDNGLLEHVPNNIGKGTIWHLLWPQIKISTLN